MHLRTANDVMAGSEIYHAATVSVEKKTTKGLTLLASYTVAKMIDDIGVPIDNYNRRLNRAVSSFDIPQRIVASFVYNLPIGKGGKFGANWNPVLNALFGNWDVSGIFILQRGVPVVINTPAVNLGQSAQLSDRSIDRWFNTSLFRPATPFTFGSLGPRLPDVRSDGFRNLDAGIYKTFPFRLGERECNAQFRAQFFNTANNPQFAAPNGSVTSQSFGTVTAQANAPRSMQFGLKISF